MDNQLAHANLHETLESMRAISFLCGNSEMYCSVVLSLENRNRQGYGMYCSLFVHVSNSNNVSCHEFMWTGDGREFTIFFPPHRIGSGAFLRKTFSLSLFEGKERGEKGKEFI